MVTSSSIFWIISMLWLTKVAYSSLINKQFWQFQFSSDLARGRYFFTASGATASACGSLCTGFPTCQSFGYNSGSLTCWLYGHLVLYTTNGTAAPGTRYFWRLSPRCPTELGYTLEEGLCFKVHQERMDFSEAREVCAGEGGTLFIADTVAKLDLLKYYVTKQTWVGGSDSENEGDWRLEDGRRLDISSPLWKRGQPDNRFGNEDGLFIASGGWLHDLNVDSKIHFACQLPLV